MAVIEGKMSAPVAIVVVAGMLGVGVFGLDGNSQFREDPFEEAKLLFAGERYKLYMHCGDARKNLKGSLIKGFLGANTYHFRAWSHDHAIRKAQAGIGANCRLTSLYHVHDSWFSKYDEEERVI